MHLDEILQGARAHTTLSHHQGDTFRLQDCGYMAAARTGACSAGMPTPQLQINRRYVKRGVNTELWKATVHGCCLRQRTSSAVQALSRAEGGGNVRMAPVLINGR